MLPVRLARVARSVRVPTLRAGVHTSATAMLPRVRPLAARPRRAALRSAAAPKPLWRSLHRRSASPGSWKRRSWRSPRLRRTRTSHARRTPMPLASRGCRRTCRRRVIRPRPWPACSTCCWLAPWPASLRAPRRRTSTTRRTGATLRGLRPWRSSARCPRHWATTTPAFSGLWWPRCGARAPAPCIA